ncbi:MAG: DUF3592 domain-containing protein [Gammaproteobacteria bacterium]|nr:DUF3592 domain-containing protein [Gammaproteobacteria bacterium]
MAFVAFGCFMLFDTYSFRKVALEITGKLKGYEHHISRSKNGSTKMYTPVIEYNYQGDEYCFKSTISSSSMPYEIGETIPVLLKKNDPDNARLKTNSRYWVGAISALLGFVTLGVGLANFNFDRISLIISAIVLTVIALQAVKFKQKLENKNIHSFKNFVESKSNIVPKSDSNYSNISATDSLFPEDDIDTLNDKNYQPSADFIQTKEQVTKHTKVPAWFAYLIVFIGLGIFIGGGYWMKQRSDFLNKAEQSTAQVVDMESSTSDGSTVYYPIVRYRYPVTGEEIQFRHQVGSSHPSWKRGDKVTVLYDPKDKNNAIIDDGWFNWFGPGLLIVMGFIFLVVGFFMVKKSNINKEKGRYSEDKKTVQRN